MDFEPIFMAEAMAMVPLTVLLVIVISPALGRQKKPWRLVKFQWAVYLFGAKLLSPKPGTGRTNSAM
jgi:hypothetical protein